MNEIVLKICSDICDKEITEEEQLLATGLLDSFGIMELIDQLETEFHVTFLPEEIMKLDNFACVKNIVNIINNKMGISE